jgi:pimeloyl-ACP methyl ester carboxylesterase
MNMYCLSGLGADQRVFKHIRIPGVRLVPVDWAPFDWHDDMACYAQKLAAAIPEKNPVILGLSFGGMLGTEITRMQEVRRLFLVSSAKFKSELPPLSGLVKYLARRRLLPVGLAKIPFKGTYVRFGAETDEEKALLTDILRKTDNRFAKWAFKTLLGWRTEDPPRNTVHLHGTADQLIIPVGVHPDHWIEGGTHFMIYNRAEEISRIIRQELDRL